MLFIDDEQILTMFHVLKTYIKMKVYGHLKFCMTVTKRAIQIFVILIRVILHYITPLNTIIVRYIIFYILQFWYWSHFYNPYPFTLRKII